MKKKIEMNFNLCLFCSQNHIFFKLIYPKKLKSTGPVSQFGLTDQVYIQGKCYSHLFLCYIIPNLMNIRQKYLLCKEISIN